MMGQAATTRRTWNLQGPGGFPKTANQAKRHGPPRRPEQPTLTRTHLARRSPSGLMSDRKANVRNPRTFRTTLTARPVNPPGHRQEYRHDTDV